MVTSYQVSGLQEAPQPSPDHTGNRFRVQCSAKLLWPHPEAGKKKMSMATYAVAHMLIDPEQQQWIK